MSDRWWYKRYTIGGHTFAVNWKMVGIVVAIWIAMLAFLPW